MTRTTVSQEQLAENIGEFVQRARHGELAVVESLGEEQAVLLDALDYRLLRAFTACAAHSEPAAVDVAPCEVDVIRDFLAERINVGRAAELLGQPRLELMDRFHRLGIPLRIGPASLEEARAEVAVAFKHR